MQLARPLGGSSGGFTLDGGARRTPKISQLADPQAPQFALSERSKKGATDEPTAVRVGARVYRPQRPHLPCPLRPIQELDGNKPAGRDVHVEE